MVGGVVVLRDGLIIAVETAAAPSLESLLLRSGRVSGDDWTDVFAEAAPQGRLRAALVERGLLGSASVQVVTQTAAMDAMFALGLADIHSCAPDPVEAGLEPLLPIIPGLDVSRVVRETRRRLAIAARWHELGLDQRTRPLATQAAPPIDAGRAEILARVNGRRTSRDLAFLLGRGLFAVMSDLELLHQDGQVTFERTATAPSQPSHASPASPAAPRRPDPADDEERLASPGGNAGPGRSPGPGPGAGPRRRAFSWRPERPT
ncbi:hypothetical protein I6A84_06480 [Frankia sp. CNm7]|uniref:Uncharacterized protein n=1 Tax=Frankia nepalensis TaxID=1836974 RepID=A0A937RHF4_9ACTN|nr:hypothetical protein [Frankia nepalensis]MBL7499695.1 hypothetical protein [Frankia nepalensis]MBL7513246.1 hypothetical protein [Frankia nepalensis]MBL7517780.1 hypothetical protein [Frankia nepalensis]MBL7626438.1 hypothetical protein [Frankia nepalensis]